MAKSAQSTKFRGVDIDELDENKFKDEGEEDSGQSGPDEAEVNNLLLQKKNAEALKTVLTNAPIMSKNQANKDKAFALIMRVLTAVKATEIEKAVNTLDKNSQDVLMKYIYRGFAEPSDGSSAVLLTWHEKVLAVGGLGSIVRVLTDRKTV
ncbi:LOW QUALITY PROTEIN: actin-related protein 2/3 complex subunit 5-C-like [Acropora millepora]|uniref:LOW QUALITY PROTEIN: actin-related protein 2/3 complex subunit 5-C-like n=1 Tax=Acropora millepora TaxID=45264 RepID=UPI001CF5661A|nr:LOW QUALITY PROTEIN: actin-related protein 2/3 complex subunit 5-C-like [Acropora millepora]